MAADKPKKQKPKSPELRFPQSIRTLQTGPKHGQAAGVNLAGWPMHWQAAIIRRSIDLILITQALAASLIIDAARVKMDT